MNFRVVIPLLVVLLISVVPQVAIPTTQIMADEYEPDNTFETATTITFGEMQTHSLHYAEDYDYIQFTVPKQTVIRITINGSSGFLHGEFWGPIRYYPISYHEGIEINTQKEVQQGTYYFVINSLHYKQIVENYNISLEFAHYDDLEPNDSFETAQEISMNSSKHLNLEFRTVDEIDIDWFKFNNTKTQFVDLQLENFDDCWLGFELYDNTSQLIAQSDRIWHQFLRKDVEKMVIKLETSVFFIQILSYDCFSERSIDYDLHLYSVQINETEPNDDLEEATFIQYHNPIQGILEFNDISNVFEEDYYNFTIDESKTIEIQLKYTVDQNFHFELLQYNGETIGYSYRITQYTGQEISILTYNTNGGTFYLTIHANRGWYQQYEQALVYEIQITDPELDMLEPNDSPETAIDIGGLDWYSTSSNLHNSTDVDWFSFSTEYSRVFRLNYNLMDQDLRLAFILYEDVDNGLEMIHYAEDGFEIEIPPGEYIFRIASTQGLIGWYNIWIDPWPYPDERESEGNDYVENAVRLRTNDYYWGNLHVSSDVDWWFFELLKASQVTVDTNGWSGSPVLILYNSDLEEITRKYRNDANPNDPFPIIEMILESGTYYLLMKQESSNQFIDWYEISLTLDPIPTDSNGPDAETVSSQLKIGDNFLAFS